VELPTAQKDDVGESESGAFLSFRTRGTILEGRSGNHRGPFHNLRTTLGLTSVSTAVTAGGLAL